MKKRNLSFIKSVISKVPVMKNIELKQITDYILTLMVPEKIICFGSKVTQTISNSCFVGEKSKVSPNSYCLLIIPPAETVSADLVIQQTIELGCKTLANVTVIVHKMKEINEALQKGSSFFTAIYKKGLLVHDLGKEDFCVPLAAEAMDQRIIRREMFWNQWFKLSSDFMSGASFYATQQINNLAVFMLHQSLQHCYSGMLRVLTGYRTNSNSLRRLLRLIENALPESSFTAIHENTPQEARLMDILLKGYSDARYKKEFEIKAEEVTELLHRIQQILNGADLICKERIRAIKAGEL